MNLLLTIVLYVIVLIHITFVFIKANLFNSDDENKLLIGRKDSYNRNSVGKKNGRKFSHLFYKGSRRNSHHKAVSLKNPSHNYKNCVMNIKTYLGKRKIYNSMNYTVWHDFDQKKFMISNYPDYISRIITHINLIRILYSACPLKESTQLDLSAQIYAKLIADKCLIGSNFKQYGVIKVALPITHLTEIVSHLYKEHIFYSFRLSYGGILTDRFTQLVWRSSTSIGIGIIRKRNLVYIALLFYPKGNIRGQYEINVLKKKISWKKMIQI
uniref:CAP domain-containing protein (inferred by orthology to a zebrafish protein) n=1 Tax=Strongyloides venezuelensis TaxID=75913 RepID=A0A0K0F286_STRVS